jgi:hypothetical protein
LVELEFIESTLNYYIDDESAQSFETAKAALETRMAAEAEIAFGDERAEEILDEAATARQKAIDAVKNSTTLMFTCFTSVKLKKKREGGESKSK